MDTKTTGLLAGGVLGGLFVGANAGKIVRGLTIGLISIAVAIMVVIYTVNGVKENSTVLESLQLTEASDAAEQRGMVMTYGQIETDNPLSFAIETCPDNNCWYAETALEVDDAIYVRVELQRFEVVRDVRESSEGTSGTTETIEYSHEWITKSTDEDWADISLSGISLNPEKARIIVDTERKEIEDAYIDNLESLETYGQQPIDDEPQFGTTRALVQYITLDDREYTVVGESRSSGITTGDPYIISDKSRTELISQLGGEETTQRWGLRFVAFLLLTFGFTSMLSPVLVFTDLIPVAGKAARGLATLASAIVAGIIVLATVFLLNYWWIIAAVLVIGAAVFAVITLMQQSKKPVSTK